MLERPAEKPIVTPDPDRAAKRELAIQKLMQQVSELSRGRCGLKITFDGTAISIHPGAVGEEWSPEDKAMLRHFYDQWRHVHDD